MRYCLTYSVMEDGRVLAIVTDKHPRGQEEFSVLTLETFDPPLNGKCIKMIKRWFREVAATQPWVTRQ